jgi:hypothetical protein
VSKFFKYLVLFLKLGMDKGRGEMKVKLYCRREYIEGEREGKNFQGNGRGWNDIDKFSLRNENLSLDNHWESITISESGPK